jgi:hypothetical protein
VEIKTLTFDSVRARRRWELVETIELLLIGHPSRNNFVEIPLLAIKNGRKIFDASVLVTGS